MTFCSKKSCLLNFLAVFIAMFAYDWLVHGQLMMPFYEDTAALWRPSDQMQQFLPFCLLYHAALAALFTCNYFCWVKKIAVNVPAELIKFSLGYGVFIGLIMGITNASYYLFLPIPGSLSLAWLAASTVQGIMVGYLLLFLYNKTCAVK